jgi:hypothetical protein
MRIASTVVVLTALLGVGLARADVYDNAAVAAQNMRRMAQACWIYANDNSERFPPLPSNLFPLLINDPLAFWHPGDSDPAPTTIDNDVPNAHNSSNISFEWVGWDYRRFACDQPLVQDNTSANNDGLFVGYLTLDGMYETVPPMATPTPTALRLAQLHLARFAFLWYIYANDHNEFFPSDPLELYATFRSPRTVWNPGDSDLLPERITNSVPNGPESVQVSFEFLHLGERSFDVPPGTIMIRDNTPANNGGYGINVIRVDSWSVEFIPVCPGDVDRDGSVNLQDLARLLANFGRLDDAYFSDGDVDGDSSVTLADLSALLANFGASCP